MYLSKKDIDNTPKVRKLNIINSVTGIKPGNLIGTYRNDGSTNLAVISSVVHLGSNPPYLGFILRPHEEVRRHTYENILENGCYTINHISPDFIKQAHYTSVKFPADVSEFQACGLQEEYIANFKAPFVKESPLKIGLRHVDSIPIKFSNTTLVVGEVEHLILPDQATAENGYIDLEKTNSVGISGLNSYYNLAKIGEFPYARVDEVPKFDQ